MGFKFGSQQVFLTLLGQDILLDVSALMYMLKTNSSLPFPSEEVLLTVILVYIARSGRARTFFVRELVNNTVLFIFLLASNACSISLK